MTAVAPVSPAHALDCAKAPARVDKVICASPSLRKADAAMSAAYFKLLRATTDREFHDALIRSQRRWLEVRSQGARGSQEDDDVEIAEREALLKVTRDRMKSLQTGELVRRMERQRGVASKDSGGAFAGYKTACYLLPPPHGWVYGCFGEGRRQNSDRICSVELTWATGHGTEYRTVSIVKDGAPKPVATCSIGYAETTERCPDADDDAELKANARWNTNPVPSNERPTPHASDLWKYDPDTSVELADQEWMRDCLSAATYPPADVNRADPAPKKP
ncbi:lysozyme inhibitor LprI family protein [Bradyrhizobium sp. CCBAU 51753]|uniref:lysozyme inhibitor LprI family protein n=1 Tax=Bradyrhizobium sp. CCBAU 51753 TaxID=1325100 RepID=UPI001FEDFC77|nr:lysozyme inhibitor LprI family protein [Bradyrhizobium sp. CCBAU 51753]